MVSLQTVGRRFESLLHTESGVPFYGTIEPNSEGRLPAYDMAEPRQILRVDHAAPVQTGDIIMDIVGRRFLLANHDVAFGYNKIEYRSHRLFPVNVRLRWEREDASVDNLTGLKRGDGSRVLIDQIWCLQERMERQFTDITIRVKEDVKRIMMAKQPELNDIIDNRVVRRVDPVLGVYVVETQ